MTYLLHNIGELSNRNYNSRGEILAANGVLTFDGVYRNVWENRDILQGRTVILFVMGDHVGKDNSFDRKMPLEKMASWDEIVDLCRMGCRLGWHTWSHRDLRKLNDEELTKEVTPPWPMDYFAYPYGRFDERVENAVRTAGFKNAYCAGKYGNGGQYQLRRRYL